MITLPFDLGQEVFIIRTQTREMPCDLCKGTGGLADESDPLKTYRCPKCSSYKTFLFDTNEWEVEEAGPVDKYEVSQYGTSVTTEKSWATDIENVFPDRESAQTEADERNKAK